MRGDRAAVGGTAGQGAPLGWEEMLASAEALAGDDPVLLALIEDAAVEATKGVASGPVYNIGRLGNGERRHLPADRVPRAANMPRSMSRRRRPPNLNLTVYDDKGRLVCSDTDISHIAYCGWTPARREVSR